MTNFTTEQLMEIYKHEMKVNTVEIFDFDMWLAEKMMIEGYEENFIATM